MATSAVWAMPRSSTVHSAAFPNEAASIKGRLSSPAMVQMRARRGGSFAGGVPRAGMLGAW